MRVLVGCECSQVIMSAFRAAGHDAFSCDLVPAYGDLPQYHLQGDLREVYDFVKPDLFIAHPPCTYLSKAAGSLLFNSKHEIADIVRYEQGLLARDFFLWCLSRPAPMICVENPVPFKVFQLPKYTQIIQPFYFGDPYYKTTCLWLRGLPPLCQSDVVRPVGCWVMTGSHSSKRRSQSFRGVAAAMVHAWGSGVLENYQLPLPLFS